MATHASALFTLKGKLYDLLVDNAGEGEPLEGVQIAYNFPADQRDELTDECIYVAGVRSRNQRPAGIGAQKPVDEFPRILLGFRVYQSTDDSRAVEERMWELTDIVADLLHNNQRPPGTDAMWWTGFGDIDQASTPDQHGWASDASIEVVARARLR